MNAIAPVALISGGSRGLGAALITSFLDSGHRVATFSRTAPGAGGRDPERFLSAAVDAGEASALKAFVDAVDARFGRIDVLVNNVSVGIDGVLSTLRWADIDHALDVNLRSAIYLSQAVSRSMLRQRSGCIINISSVNAVRGHAGVSIYSATKAGIEGLTRSLARELGPRSIRVNAVAPGYFESEMVSHLSDADRERIVRRTPLGRLATIAEVVSVVRFLASPAAAFITGQSIVVDGGLSC